MTTPSGYEGIVKAYGDPKPYYRHDGTLDSDWERHILKLCEFPAGCTLPLGWNPDVRVERFRCHFSLVPHFRAVFDGIKANGLWDQLRTFDGCYSYRPQRGSSKLSTHAWGIAIDLNAATNQLGEPGDMSPDVIQLFEAAGFQWGGRFDRPDFQHFQRCRNY